MEAPPMKISHSGLLARSPEGHAARGGLSIKGNEDVWVEIQANTFRNWVNENLPSDLKVVDLSQDLCTGVRLCTLVEKLQGKPLRGWNRRPGNQHHYLENVACALSSVEGDGVKLVNIGNLDIVNGNLKLILGLIWSLIVRYQIGRSKFPPRKLMLAWLQAVLPECKVNNLTTDWNSGVLLSALVDHCRPGLFSHWRRLDKHNGINNCRNAMELAQKQLGIPAVLEPEYLASPWLDELSGMTYLSYFMKPGSPGFHATLRWVNSRLDRSVKNFTSDWNDGKAISEVIRSLGGSAIAPEKLRTDPAYWESNLIQAVEAGKRLGVQPVLQPKDMADHNVEHLGVMAYAAYFQWIPERPPLHDLVNVKIDSTSGRVGEPTRYQITLLSDQLTYSKISAEIRAPDNRYYTAKTLRDGSGTYIPQKVGMHELIIRYEGEEVSTKHYFRALPPLVEVVPPGMAPCALGSIVQVLVNATGAPKREDILVTAFSPLGRPLECPLTTIDGTNTATFKPDEAGIWRIEITYQGKHIQGGPFTCAVFDPNGVVVSGIEGALPMVPHAIDLDCRDVCVPGDVYADVVYDKRSLHTRMERVDIDGYLHRVHFTPVNPGKHRVYVYFNGYDVKGSPFMMRVGTQRRSKHNAAADVRSTTNEAKPGIYTVSPVQEHHSQSHSKYLSSERRLSADSPAFDTLGAASFIPRASSPSLAPRTQSPTFRPQSPNFRPLSPLRPGSPHHMMSSSMYNTSSNMKQSSHILRSKSPDFARGHSPSLITSRLLNNKLSSSPRGSPVNITRDDYNSGYQLGKMRLSNRSPGLQELRSNSPDYGYSSTRYNKSMAEQRSYNNSFDKIESSYSNGINPVIKFPVSPTPSPVGGRRLESWDVVGRTNDVLEQQQQQQHQVMRSRDYSYKAGVGMSRVGGATAVKVQDIPDGVVGRPVDFESRRRLLF